MRIFMFLLSVLFAADPSLAIAETTERQMAARAAESLARASGYEMVAIQTFWGDAAVLKDCVSSNHLPKPFTVYFEVLENGALGETIFTPLTDEANCIKQHTLTRTFPRPPGGAYVAKIAMSFNP